MRNLFQVLGLRHGASLEEIKSAYRRLAMQTHPDRGGDAEKFIKIKEAYDQLFEEAGRSRATKPTDDPPSGRAEAEADEPELHAWIDRWLRRGLKEKWLIEILARNISFRRRTLMRHAPFDGRQLKVAIKALMKWDLVRVNRGWYRGTSRLHKLMGYLYWRGVF